jgi:hypothetical protein
MKMKMKETNETLTDLLGKPQGNELVWGKEIIRRVAQFDFKTLWVFDNHTQAKESFNSWKEENDN